jgi:hypothetical protein
VPPPAYPPPRRYYQHYYPAPQPLPVRSVIDRPFTIGGGGGFGGLQFRDANGASQSNAAGAYTFRLGFGLHPGVILMWDVEGAVASDDWTSQQQTAHLAALQLFLTNRLFIKGGVGAAHVDQVAGPQVWEGRWGAAAMGGIGYELIQGYHWSFDLEATVTGAHYAQTADMPAENWTNWSLVNFAINFF